MRGVVKHRVAARRTRELEPIGAAARARELARPVPRAAAEAKRHRFPLGRREEIVKASAAASETPSANEGEPSPPPPSRGTTAALSETARRDWWYAAGMVSESFHRSIGAARMVSKTTTAMFLLMLSFRLAAILLVDRSTPFAPSLLARRALSSSVDSDSARLARL